MSKNNGKETVSSPFRCFWGPHVGFGHMGFVPAELIGGKGGLRFGSYRLTWEDVALIHVLISAASEMQSAACDEFWPVSGERLAEALGLQTAKAANARAAALARRGVLARTDPTFNKRTGKRNISRYHLGPLRDAILVKLGKLKLAPIIPINRLRITVGTLLKSDLVEMGKPIEVTPSPAYEFLSFFNEALPRQFRESPRAKTQMLLWPSAPDLGAELYTRFEAWLKTSGSPEDYRAIQAGSDTVAVRARYWADEIRRVYAQEEEEPLVAKP